MSTPTQKRPVPGVAATHETAAIPERAGALADTSSGPVGGTSGGTVPVSISDPLPPTAVTIVESAARLFAQKGFSSTSIREIALAAGVTKPTIYYYFGSKQGLIQHLLGSSMRAFQETLDAALALPTLDAALTHLLRHQLRFADERPATVTMLARVDMLPEDEIGPFQVHAEREKTNVALFSLFQNAIARGEIRGHDPALLTASFIGALVVHLMMRIQRPDIQLGSPESAAVSIVRLFLDGATPRSRDS